LDVVGVAVGLLVGLFVIGLDAGDSEGLDVVGKLVGIRVRLFVGDAVGLLVGLLRHWRLSRLESITWACFSDSTDKNDIVTNTCHPEFLTNTWYRNWYTLYYAGVHDRLYSTLGRFMGSGADYVCTFGHTSSRRL
jgi:hypothetical protein